MLLRRGRGRWWWRGRRHELRGHARLEPHGSDGPGRTWNLLRERLRRGSFTVRITPRYRRWTRWRLQCECRFGWIGWRCSLLFVSRQLYTGFRGHTFERFEHRFLRSCRWTLDRLFHGWWWRRRRCNGSWCCGHRRRFVRPVRWSGRQRRRRHRQLPSHRLCHRVRVGWRWPGTLDERPRWHERGRRQRNERRRRHGHRRRGRDRWRRRRRLAKRNRRQRRR